MAKDIKERIKEVILEHEQHRGKNYSDAEKHMLEQGYIIATLDAAYQDVFQGPRSEVKKFAVTMEKELKENDHKGGWKNCSLLFLIEKLHEEVKELIDVAWQCEAAQEDIESTQDGIEFQRAMVRSEAADVGNIAMMITDICRAL